METASNKSYKELFLAIMANLDTTSDDYNRRTVRYECNMPIPHKCPIKESCIGGVNATCIQGYTGVLCAVCEKGFMKNFGKCIRCPSAVVAVLQFLAYIVVFVLLCWLVSLTDRKRMSNSNETRGDSEVITRDDRTFADAILSSFKILIGFYQVLSGMHPLARDHENNNEPLAYQAIFFASCHSVVTHFALQKREMEMEMHEPRKMEKLVNVRSRVGYSTTKEIVAVAFETVMAAVIRLGNKEVLPATTEGSENVFSQKLFTLEKRRWMKDEEVHLCPLCNNKFSQIRRKHHCRQCGRIFCSKCCDSKVSLSQLGYDEPQRVCESCAPVCEIMSKARSPQFAKKLEAAQSLAQMTKEIESLIKVVELGGIQTLIYLSQSINDGIKASVADAIHTLATQTVLHPLLVRCGAIKAICRFLGTIGHYYELYAHKNFMEMLRYIFEVGYIAKGS
eukprot:gene13553-4441_t